MTAADLGAVTKPWVVHRHVSQLLAEEFWAQGEPRWARGGSKNSKIAKTRKHVFENI